MKFDFDQSSESLVISHYSADGITIGTRTMNAPFVAHGADLLSELLPRSYLDLEYSHVAAVVELGAGIIIIGTGGKQHFYDIDVLRPALENGVGVEAMQTGAACRSYNVLIAEGRSVAGVFFPLNDAP